MTARDIHRVTVINPRTGINEAEELEHEDLAIAWAHSRVEHCGIGTTARVYNDDLQLIAELESTKAGIFRTQ